MVALVNSWNGVLTRLNSVGIYGIGVGPPSAASLGLTVANTGNIGNWMLALVTWRLPAAFYSTVAVGDDAGNLWEPLGAPTGTSTATGLTRCSIWYSVNPKPAAFVYVSPNGYTGGLACVVDELSGLSPWQTLTGITTGYQAAAATAANWLTGNNAAFDTSSGTWTGAGNSTIAQTTSQAHSGSGSLQITSAAAGTMDAASCLAANIATQGVPCNAGDTISCSGWFLAATTGRSVQVGATFYTSAGGLISSLFGGTVTDGTGGWVQATASVTAPATAAYCRLVAQVVSTAGASEVHYFDDGYIADATLFTLAMALPAPSAQALFVTCFGGDTDLGTVSGPGAGWTSLGAGGGTNGADHSSDTAIQGAFQVSSGAVTAVWTDTASVNLSGVLAGVLITGTAPVAPVQTWPLTRYQAAFGAGAATPWDMITWTDLTARYRGMSGQRGKQYELDVLQAGTSNYTLSNNDAALTPGNQASGYWLGVSGWNVTLGSATLTPSQLYSWQGMATALYTPDGITANGHAETGQVAVTAGLVYTGSVWVLCPQGWTAFQAQINWYNASHTYLATSSGAGISPSPAWQQATVTGLAPAGAAFGTLVVQPSGTPPTTTQFWFAAAMLQNPAGQIINANWQFGQGPQVFTPVRLLATWPPPPALNAVTYPVKREFMERWPQQLTASRYQVTNGVGTDVWALLTTLLKTAARAEVLQDQPSAFWPLDDAAGSLTARQIAGTGVGPLTVAASRNGTGTAAQTFGVSASALVGDPSATGWQQSGVPASDTEGYSLYTADVNLPPISGGVTIAGWFNLTASQPTGANLNLITVRNSKGTVLVVFVQQSTGDIFVGVVDKITGTQTNTNVAASTSSLNGLWTHIAIEFTPTSWTVVTNDGIITAPVSGTANFASTPYWLCFNGAADRSFGGAFFNGIISSLAVFPQLLPLNRVASQYWAYLAGVPGDFPVNRIDRLLGAGNCAFPRAIGGGGEGLVGALDIGGQAVSQNVANIAESDNGFLLVNGAGYLRYLERLYSYNLAVTFTLGEQVAVQLNANSMFNTTISPWIGANSATVSLSSIWAYSGMTSLLMHGNGSTANPEAVSEQTIPVTPGTSYTASAWLYSPQGWATVLAGINWYTSGSVYISTSFTNYNLPAAVPLEVVVSGQAPATAAFGQIVFQLTGTPASTVQLFADLAELTTTYTEQPYLADVQFDYDNSQVFNDLTLSQLASPAVVQYSFAAFTAGSLFVATGVGPGFQFVAGQPVILTGGGTIPTPFVQGQTYYVINVTGNSFQLSATSGGAAITVTAAGTGTVTGITPASGVTVALSSAASIAAYGDQTLQQTVYLADPLAVADQGSWILNTLGTPAIRVSQITLDPSANPALWPVALGAECGQVYQVLRRLGSGTESPPEISELVQVMSVAHSNQPGSWRTVLGLVPYYGTGLMLDDPVRGVLDGLNRITW